ncbi:MAG: alpha/beta hydrolase [Myxococcales bacterium]|nr:alpha/beta hydrolase [Myxococcales bacterium]
MLRIGGRLTLALAVALTLLVTAFTLAYWEPDRSVVQLTARWAAPPSTFIDVAGLPVHLRDQGPTGGAIDAEPIVLLHGTSASLHTWDGWAPSLARTRRVIRMDLPGFGLTGPTPTHDYSLDGYTRFVIAVLDALSVRRCVLAGNSLGGAVAISVARQAPARVSKLVLVDSGGYAPRATSMPIGFRIAQTPGLNKLMLFTLPRSVVASSLRDVYGDPSRVTPELIDRYFELTLRAGNRAAVTERLRTRDFGALEAEIPKLTQPTLILWGGRDRLILPENAARFQREIRGSELVVFDDLGHVPHEESPERSVAPVAAFVSR